ncbi:MAG: tyrosine-protein phosphatase [Oscillospiraceae bacterium]|nr:tyrosine-protein phosphatase [Oscillospiraceae bacterium]
MKKSFVTLLTRLLVLVFVFGLVGIASFRTVSYADHPRLTLVKAEESALPVTEDVAEAETEAAAEETEEATGIEAGIVEIEKYGNIVLSVSPATMRELGYEPGDIISVTIGDETMEMPIGVSYADVDTGAMVCRFLENVEGIDPEVALAINMGNLAGSLGIAEKVTIPEKPGFRWDWNEGFDENTSVSISMAEKQGYADGLLLHQVMENSSMNREDYPDLTDEEYANFREVTTTGMGVGTLYRSSSPINPVINRNREADDALLMAGISTVMNMADHPDVMKQYDGYANTFYSDCDIIALNMGMDYTAEEYQAQLAEGFRFLAEQEGPYLIHCNEGKDRTGFAVAVLECLMGADADEVVADYMLTFQNYFGVEPGTDTWQRIAAGNIQKELEQVFGIENLYDEKLDLSACAEQYLRDIGMTKDEILTLEDKLSVDYGGLADDDDIHDQEEADPWDCSVDTEVTENLDSVFEDALQELLGVKYEPVALLAEQAAEEGTEYCFLARATTVYPGAEPYFALVYVQEANDGDVQLKNIRDFSIAEFLNTDEENAADGEADPADDWDCSVDTKVTEELDTAFEDAVQGLLGVSYEPVALLAEKENGEDVDYCFLTRATAVYPGAEPYYAAAFVQVGEEGKAQLLGVYDFMIADDAEEPVEEPAEAEAPPDEDVPADVEEPVEAGEEALSPENWDFSFNPEITEESQKVFDKAVQGLLGVNYEPIVLLGQLETEEGTTYCFVSRATAVYPDAEPYYTIVFIQEHPSGEVELLDLWDFEIDEFADFDDFAEVS